MAPIGRAAGVAVTAALAFAASTPISAQQRGRQAREEVRSAIRGTVVDGASERPVEGVLIRLEGTDLQAVTDERGEFRIAPVTSGAQVIVTTHLAYVGRRDSLDVPTAALLDVTITLATQALEMEELVVVVRSPVLERHGFYGRARQGYGGVFLDRVEIEKRNPETVTSLFRNMPGLRVIYGGIQGSKVFMNQRNTFSDGTLPGCEPQLWIDGIRSAMTSYDLMRAEEIEGIEVYSGGSAPGKFNDICGTVVVWTRVPVNR